MPKLKRFVTDNRTRIFWTLVTVSVLVLLALFAFGVWRCGWTWTGFCYYTTPKSDTEEFHPGKTLWDVLDLIIIPAVLLGLAALFRKIESNRETRREELDREFEQDRQREAALQTYLDQMTKLLLDKELLVSKSDDPVRAVAQTLTVVTMRRLDGKRNETLLRFLDDARLIKKDKPVIHFEGADLSKIDLSETRPPGINLLRKAILREAILEGANLMGAYLVKANLEGANLWEASLEGADLEGAEYDGTTEWPKDFTPPPEAINLDKKQG
jgi:hypothetical protein